MRRRRGRENSMTSCYDEGWLRAYLDDELPTAQRDTVARHLSGCADCRERLEALRSQAARVGVLLAPPLALPDARAAFDRLMEGDYTAHVAEAGTLPLRAPRGIKMKTRGAMQHRFRTWIQTHRGMAASIAAVVLSLALLALPPVRALADQFLQIFRVQQVMFVPISAERLEQLEDLDFDGDTLFVGEPEIINDPAEPYEVDSVADAEGIVGFDLQEPAVFPSDPISQTVMVNDAMTARFQVNVAASNDLLQLMGITDITIPEALGSEPITADVPSSAVLAYGGENYNLVLFQGRSPEISLPEGVDLELLGEAALRLFGMEPEQAASLSQQIDWSSTLIFPFPANLDSVRQVTVSGSDGLLVEGGGEDEAHWQLYWQQGERAYVLFGEGWLGQDDIVLAAESLQ